MRLIFIIFLLAFSLFLGCKNRREEMKSKVTAQERSTRVYTYEAKRFLVFSASFTYKVTEISNDTLQVNTVGSIHFMGMEVHRIIHQSLNDRSSFLPRINTQYDGGKDLWYTQKFLPHHDYFLYREHNENPTIQKDLREGESGVSPIYVDQYYNDFQKEVHLLHDFSSVVLSAGNYNLSNEKPSTSVYLTYRNRIKKIDIQLVKTNSKGIQEFTFSVAPNIRGEIRDKNVPDKLIYDSKNKQVLSIFGHVPSTDIEYELKLVN